MNCHNESVGRLLICRKSRPTAHLGIEPLPRGASVGREWGAWRFRENVAVVRIVEESGANGARIFNSILYVGVLFSSYAKDFKIRAPRAPLCIKIADGTAFSPKRSAPHWRPTRAPLGGSITEITPVKGSLGKTLHAPRSSMSRSSHPTRHAPRDFTSPMPMSLTRLENSCALTGRRPQSMHQPR